MGLFYSLRDSILPPPSKRLTLKEYLSQFLCAFMNQQTLKEYLEALLEQ
jgi:hypothetical protein